MKKGHNKNRSVINHNMTIDTKPIKFIRRIQITINEYTQRTTSSKNHYGSSLSKIHLRRVQYLESEK